MSSGLEVISLKGTLEILRRLSVGEGRFKDLNEVVGNTRTLAKRVMELRASHLMEKAGTLYRITDEGFNLIFKVADIEGRPKVEGLREKDLAKVKYEWMRVSLRRLIEIFSKELGEVLISVVLYGSLVKDTFKLGGSDVDLLYVVEDGVRDLWAREQELFTLFKSTWEYRACDYWLRMRGFYGYPDVSVVALRRSHAQVFQPIYLDMLLHKATLYDRGGFFDGLMSKLKEELKALGARRVEYADGTWCWFLKPKADPGELIKIDLGS